MTIVSFYSVLSGLRSSPHIDAYVTGSNSKLLISDVATEFRGRGQIIQTTPLSFAEYRDFRSSEANPLAVLQEYIRYGGLPECALKPTLEEKETYLRSLFSTIYIKDIVERNKIQNVELLETVIDIVMSNIAGTTDIMPQRMLPISSQNTAEPRQKRSSPRAPQIAAKLP